MHFSFNDTDKEKLISLFNQHEYNLDYLIYLKDIIWQNLSICIDNNKNQTPFDVRKELINQLDKKAPFPNTFVKNALSWEANLLRIDAYETNPYLKALNGLSFSKDGWSLNSKVLKAFSLFPKEDEFMVGTNYTIKMNIGFFDKDYSYPSISLYNQEWMSLNPYEIRTMEIPIQLAKGNVLTLGLGLGYYAYIAHLKEEVKEVHIVEMDLELIKIFNEYLLPLFPHKEKVHIHRADAFYFVQNINDGDYDLIFSDLWHDVSDGVVSYLKLKKRFNDFKRTQCTYWIEDAIITYLRLLVIGVMKDEFYQLDNDYDELQLFIKNRLKDYQLISTYDLDSLLNIKGLGTLLLK